MASDAEIKAAFKRLAAQHHPDKNNDSQEAQARFKEINAAYQLLCDPNKRAIYDRFGASGVGVAEGGFENIGFETVVSDLLGAFGIKRGEGTVREQVTVSFEEAALGCERRIEYQRIDSCDGCEGTGAAPGSRQRACTSCGGQGKVKFQRSVLPLKGERTCSECRGTGVTTESACQECKGRGLRSKAQRRVIDIPPGADDGSVRTISKAGHRLAPKGKIGNLEVKINVAPHPFFKRVGSDITCQLPITFVQAALGDQVEIPTLEGKILLKIPASTQPGSVLRVRGKGVLHRLRSTRGDQLVEVSVEVPSSLSERARKLLEQLADELGEDVQPQRRTFTQKLRSLFG